MNEQSPTTVHVLYLGKKEFVIALAAAGVIAKITHEVGKSMRLRHTIRFIKETPAPTEE